MTLKRLFASDKINNHPETWLMGANISVGAMFTHRFA